ncbi:MAG: hypothetical protein NTX59_10990 [Elusimicrobia bacterium]|nr:hypothetical protein [Elusimicrobiota bacterium]
MNVSYILKKLVLLLPLMAAPAAAQNAHPWVFFDLGKTLIDHTPQYTDMKYIPGARKYLKDLKSRGFHLGMLINWPEEEGNSNAEKLELVKQFLFNGWNDPAPFDWDMFEAVLFPPKNELRKPNPYLFLQALKTAGPDGAVYQGENPAEIAAAQKAGLPAHRVIFFPGPGEKPTTFLSADEIISMLSRRGPEDGAARFDGIPAGDLERTELKY